MKNAFKVFKVVTETSDDSQDYTYLHCLEKDHKLCKEFVNETEALQCIQDEKITGLGEFVILNVKTL